jgi:hypothetical protein
MLTMEAIRQIYGRHGGAVAERIAATSSREGGSGGTLVPNIAAVTVLAPDAADEKGERVLQARNGHRPAR